jgi:hypothetical protein
VVTQTSIADHGHHRHRLPSTLMRRYADEAGGLVRRVAMPGRRGSF